MDAPTISRLGDSQNTLTEEVYRELRRSVASGAISPGSQFTIAELSSRMHVSRTPVSHAVARLEQDGLVRSESRYRFFVPALSPEEATYLGEARLICQLYFARQALPFLTSEAIEQIRAGLGTFPDVDTDEALRRRGSGIGGQLTPFVDNPFVRAWHEWVDLKLQPYRLLTHETLTPEERQQILAEHDAILEALVTRDWSAIEAAMSVHSRQHTARMLLRLDLFSGADAGAG